MLEKKWRMLDYGVTDPRMNLAIDETILRCRNEGLVPNTIRLWQNRDAVVVGCNDSVESEVDLEACRSFGIPITRRISAGETVYQDEGNLNFTIVLSEKSFPLPENLLDSYKLMCKGVAKALNSLGVDATIDDYGQTLLSRERRVVEAGQYFFYDLTLFHGTIYVDTDLARAKEVLKRRGKPLTTLRNELGEGVPSAKLKQSLVEGFQSQLDIELSPKKTPTEHEEILAERLYAVKYSKDEWNIRARHPLSLKDVLIEVYVAYPPTSMCRRILDTVSAVASKFPGRVEIRTWMRGRGLDGAGCPPGVNMSHGLHKASKESIVPAIIINGEIAFGRAAPSDDDLAEAISRSFR